MNSFLDLLIYTLPSIIIATLVYFLVRSFLKNEETNRNRERLLENHKLITPIRLQSYERLILLLERISPESLIPRLNKGKISAKQFQTLLINAIRGEFEHNLSQQLYVSPEAWELVKNAKSNIIKLINTSAEHLEDEANSQELSKLIFQQQVEMENKPNDIAIRFLKSEAKKMF